MDFSDFSFIFIYLPILVFCYRITPAKAREHVLLIGSLVFYGLLDIRILPALLITTLLNWFFHVIVFHVNKKTPWLVIFICIDAASLVYCKIFDVTPVGYSFVIFQAISLLVDTRAEKVGFADYMNAICMLPKLTMGPLVRYRDLTHDRTVEEGCKTFVLGLGIKVFLADGLATLWSSICTSGASGITTATAWLGAVAFSLELYYDFVGYTYMALGMGAMFGYRLPENFNLPYTARSMSEFWRRWHMSLSSWFRDYVYIPLGGNRKGRARQCLNIIVVWALTGLWHGFAFNYLIWAGLICLIILLEKLTPLKKMEQTKVIGHIYLLVLMAFVWMCFANTDLNNLWEYLQRMVGIYDADANPAKAQFLRYLTQYWYLLAIGIFLATPWPKKFWDRFRDEKWMAVPLLALFGFCIYELQKSTASPFLYFQF